MVQPDSSASRETAGAVSGPDDETILRLLESRQPDGLRHLLEKYGSSVRWWLRREYSLLSDGELDEVLNLSAFAAWRSFATFDRRRGTLRAWFYVIARRAAIGVVRRELKARQRSVPDGVANLASFEHRPGTADPPDEEKQQFLEDLRDCIDKLPGRQRAVIQADLEADERADAEALGEALGTTANSIYASRSLARKALKQCLMKKGHEFSP